MTRSLFHARICYALRCFIRNQTYGTTSETFTALISPIQERSATVSGESARMKVSKLQMPLKGNSLGSKEN
jgi:hypothetical protein